jgi:hypothetical protein
MLGASRYEREDFDAYHTVDPMCLDALLAAIPIHRDWRILEPAAGRGHLVKGLRDAGYRVDARDLIAHPDPLVDDIATGRNIMEIATLAGYDAVITNLPYNEQDALLAHLLPMAERRGVLVATLTRAPWHIAKKRRALVHEHPNFEGIVMLPRRPWWSDERKAAPRHEFCWNVWGASPRCSLHPVIYYPAWETDAQ